MVLIVTCQSQKKKDSTTPESNHEKIGIELFHKGQYEEAEKWLSSANELSTNGKVHLGLIYSYGGYDTTRLKKSREILTEVYNQGVDSIVVDLSTVYTLLGQREEGLELLKRSANINSNTDAMCKLGSYYDTYFNHFYNYLPPADAHDTSQLYWYKRAANLGDPFGMYQVGYIYECGMNIPVNFDSAYYWYSKAKELGDGFAMIKVGKFLIEGKAVKQDFSAGWKLLENVGESGTTPEQLTAYSDMGEIYFNGIFVKQDLQKALEYYETAKKKGSISVDAQVKEIKLKLNPYRKM